MKIVQVPQKFYKVGAKAMQKFGISLFGYIFHEVIAICLKCLGNSNTEYFRGCDNNTANEISLRQKKI
jgi:hypothetical protein